MTLFKPQIHAEQTRIRTIHFRSAFVCVNLRLKNFCMKHISLRIFLLTLLVFIHSPAFSQRAKRQRTRQPSGAAREALLASMTALSNAKSFHFKEVSANSGKGLATKVVNTGTFLAPDKYHATTDMNLIGNIRSAEMIVVGEEIFLKIPGGQWEKTSADATRIAREFAKIRNNGLLENLLKAKAGNVLWVGKVKLDGEAHDIYQFSYTTTINTPVRVRNKVWVKTSDGLPSKIEVHYNVDPGGLLKFTINTTTSYSFYNQPIEIKAPM